MAVLVEKKQTFDQWRQKYNDFATEYNNFDLSANEIILDIQYKAVPKTLTTSSTNFSDTTGHTHQVNFPIVSVNGLGGAVNLTVLTPGTGLSGQTYNGSTARTWAISYGTTLGTACQGNDARLSNDRNWTGVFSGSQAATARTSLDLNNLYLQKSQNLLDLPNKTTAITNLGLGNHVTHNYGQLPNTVTQGNDARLSNDRNWTGAFSGSQAATARTSLGFNLTSVQTTGTSKTLVDREFCMVIGTGVTLTLPGSPTAGMTVMASVTTSTNTSINRNGARIMGLLEDMTIDRPDVTVTLRYADATRGWRII